MAAMLEVLLQFPYANTRSISGNFSSGEPRSASTSRQTVRLVPGSLKGSESCCGLPAWSGTNSLPNQNASTPHEHHKTVAAPSTHVAYAAANSRGALVTAGSPHHQTAFPSPKPFVSYEQRKPPQAQTSRTGSSLRRSQTTSPALWGGTCALPHRLARKIGRYTTMMISCPTMGGVLHERLQNSQRPVRVSVGVDDELIAWLNRRTQFST